MALRDIAVLADRSARTIGGILGKERTKYTALSCIPHNGVVERVNEGRNAKNIREKNKFLANGCACLAHSGQELNRIHPFFRRDAA